MSSFSRAKLYPRRILIVEDNDAFVAQIAEAIDCLGIGGSVSVCASAGEALRLLADERQRIDLALVDLGLPDISGVEVIAAARRRFPEIPILVLSDISAERSVLAAIRAGARGYLLKGCPVRELASSISEVILGNYPISPALARTLFRMAGAPISGDSDFKLSPRELETLIHLSRGHKYEDVARLMGVTLSTVQSNIRNLYRKLDVHSQVQAISKARDAGLL